MALSGLKKCTLLINRSNLLNVFNLKKIWVFTILSLGNTCWMTLKKFPSKCCGFLVKVHLNIFKTTVKLGEPRIKTIHFSFYLSKWREVFKTIFQSGCHINFKLILWLRTKDVNVFNSTWLLSTEIFLKKAKKCKLVEIFKLFRVFGLQLYKNATHVFKHTANLYLQIHLISHSLT